MTNKIISKTIELLYPELKKGLAPKADFILGGIEKQGINPVRWAIIDVKDDAKGGILVLSVSGYELH